jgi:hypothetical protein
MTRCCEHVWSVTRASDTLLVSLAALQRSVVLMVSITSDILLPRVGGDGITSNRNDEQSTSARRAAFAFPRGRLPFLRREPS